MSDLQHAKQRVAARFNNCVGKHAKIEVGYAVSLNETSLEGGIKIGAWTYSNEGTDIKHAVIGRYCSIAPRVTISPNRHPTSWLSTHPAVLSRSYPQYNDSINRTVKIGNDVWIGTGAIVMAGVTIGDGAVIGSNTIVTSDVAEYDIVVGTPQRAMRKRFPDEVVEKLLELKWWDYDICSIANSDAIDFSNINKAIECLRILIEEGKIKKIPSETAVVSVSDKARLHNLE
ncbi:CatB-related O-acetyltransferase [Burkholderia cenocepacia]|uniref:CatB-related O-acetyltransferase n=1 Tax=Burkholderia cenocepacia TaxID=95486 RepID=A0A6B2MCQ1_9BURK|nr:CatB-related O-acetyltransferase [Burkholderia cenocepacia]NDV73024.1 CatB-related O-acetyltransferase [Burkholderia cenocepacia]